MKKVGNEKNNEEEQDLQESGDRDDDSIEVEERIPTKVLNRLPDLTRVLERLDESGLGDVLINGESRYSGPLPKQVVDNLDTEQRTKLIDDYIETKDHNRKMQKLMAENYFKDNESERKIGKFRLVFLTLTIVGVFLSLVFTGNEDTFLKLLPYAGLAIGGSGITIIYLQKDFRKKKENTPPEDED
jgi:hypothetical protein